MRHVTPDALDQLEPLLERLREIPELREKKRGVFYRKSKAFLHFHEDPAGLFADLRKGLDLRPLPTVVSPSHGTLPQPRYARNPRELLQLPLEITDEPN